MIDPQQFLAWLMTTGAAVVVVALASWLAERWPWWEEQEPQVKRALSALASGLIAVGAWAVLVYGYGQPWTDPLGVFLSAVVAFLGGQLWHANVPQETPGDERAAKEYDAVTAQDYIDWRHGQAVDDTDTEQPEPGTVI